MINVAIGIQARSTSRRFPGKVYETIDGVEMLEHVVRAAQKSLNYMNRNTVRSGINVTTAVLCPEGDPIRKKYEKKISVILGDEFDVLSRYVKLSEKFDPDWIVRITGDCPLLPSFLISKLVTIAVKNKYDYVSNVHESVRTSIDGYDVEVMSKAALAWADKNAKAPSDREHVTTILRTDSFKDAGFTSGFVLNHLNQSHVKLSVDTREDLELVRAEYERIKRQSDKAYSVFGKTHVHQV